jgi:hypothetical protein
MDTARTVMCPSAQPGMKDPRLIGVVTHDEGEPRIAYLNEQVPITEELLVQIGPAQPSQVFRIAAHCEEKRCTHFNGQRCKLATRIVEVLPAVVDALPHCLIRSSCRWYAQEGKEACFRCPQVVTEPLDPTPEYQRAVLPRD